MVDDIGVQYFNKKDADHSCWPLKQLNQGKLPCENRLDTGSKYIGIDLDWNYKIEQVVLLVEGYVKKH